jgi:feruloyl esterase
MLRHLAPGLALGWAVLGAASCAAASPCTDLNGTHIRNGLVRQAEDIRAGDMLTLNGAPVSDLPAFCRIAASAGVDRKSNILLELWLPRPEAWNGKFLGTGNGGFAGSISFGALRGGLKRGYAVVNTDMGTFPASSAGWAAGTGQPEMLKDWGYRSTHEMTVIGSALTKVYYGRAPRFSYFLGCSTGGHQALMEAQLYPNDYDAIIAGAPANNRTRLHMAFLQTGMAVHAAPDSYITAAIAAMVHEAVLKSCAGKDGGAPGDRFLTDPGLCDFQPRSLACKPGADPATCLNAAQADALARIYRGSINPRTDKVFYPGWTRGSEPQIANLFGLPDQPLRGFVGTLVPWAMGPKFDVTKFDFDKDLAKVDRELGPVMNHIDPDLSAFAAHGGKLIIFHGWADAIVGPYDTVNYFDRIGMAMPDRDSFVRLYMAPGMGHCSGGDGPDAFGQRLERPEEPAGHDLMQALESWREDGHAPGAIIAAKRDADGAILASRPLCVYPAKAVYKDGDPRVADSFRCTAAPGARFERPAPEYLKRN